LSLFGFQTNNFDEAGMFGRKHKREWQSSSVIASFKLRVNVLAAVFEHTFSFSTS
jgi:hypothetical protein